MTTMNDKPENTMRRVRPWLAGLLTFLSWGMGLYYARRTRAALYVVGFQVLVTLFIIIAFLIYLALNGPIRIPFSGADESLALDLILWILSAIIAVFVWRYVAKHNPLVERAGPTRLFGYAGIYLLPAIAAILVALPIKFFLMQPFNIPAGSMKPTLQVGDFFAVQKTSYGYSRQSIAPIGAMLPEGRVFAKQPNRGDVVVFKNAKDRNLDYVKRVVGLPGDKIQMINGLLHINGVPVQKQFIETRENVCGEGFSAPIYRETLNNDVEYLVQECAGDNGALDNVGPYHVPERHYFMLGDNRDQSQDSRIMSMVGFIHFDNLLGKTSITNNTTDETLK